MGAHIRFDDDEIAQTATTPAQASNQNLTQLPSGSKSNVPSYKVEKVTNRIQKPSRNKGRVPHRANGVQTGKSVRNQVRAIQRLLKNKANELTPRVRKEKEEEMQQLLRIRDERDRRKLEKEMAEQYRMIKFFERRKLERILEKIIKNGDKPGDAERKKQVLCDLRYVQEYPKDKKYIALFPSEGHTEESLRKVEEMRNEIKQRSMDENAGERSSHPKDSKVEGQVLAVQDDFFVDDGGD